MHPYFRGFWYTFGGCGNVYSGWWAHWGRIFRLFRCCMRLRNVSMMSDSVNIMPDAKCGVQIYKRSRWASRSSVNFVQFRDCQDQRTCPALQNMGGSAFQEFCLYTNICNALGTKQSVHTIIDSHFSGVFVRRGSIALTVSTLNLHKTISNRRCNISCLHKLTCISLYASIRYHCYLHMVEVIEGKHEDIHSLLY